MPCVSLRDPHHPLLAVPVVIRVSLNLTPTSLASLPTSCEDQGSSVPPSDVESSQLLSEGYPEVRRAGTENVARARSSLFKYFFYISFSYLMLSL